MRELDDFTRAYLGCALWSSTDDKDEPIDNSHDISDVSDECLQKAIEDCAAFQRDNAQLLEQAYALYSHSPEWSHAEQAGHDFWLTRNRHGAGFWDRGLGPVGQKLTDAAHTYGECNLYIGDDHKVYSM